MWQKHMIRVHAVLADSKCFIFLFFIFYYQIETENARIVSEQVDVEKLNLKRDSKCVYRCLSEL